MDESSIEPTAQEQAAAAAILDPDAGEPKGGETYGPDGQLDDSLKVESVIVEAPEVERSKALDALVESGEAEVVVPPDAVVIDDPDALVEMIHPDTPGDETAQVTLAAFRETWAAKGFRRVIGRRDDGSIVVAVDETVDVSDANDSATGSTEDGAEPVPDSEGSTGTESEADTSTSRPRRR